MWRKGQVFNLPEAAFFLSAFFCLRQPRTFDTVDVCALLGWRLPPQILTAALVFKKLYGFFFFLPEPQSVIFLLLPDDLSFPFLTCLTSLSFFFQHFTLIRREIFWVGIYSVEVRCFSFFTSISSGFNLLGYSTTFVILYVGNL